MDLKTVYELCKEHRVIITFNVIPYSSELNIELTKYGPLKKQSKDIRLTSFMISSMLEDSSIEQVITSRIKQVLEYEFL